MSKKKTETIKQKLKGEKKMKKKMKKVLSATLTLALVAMNAVVPVNAETVTDYADYVRGEIHANLIPDATAGGGFMYFGTRISQAEYTDFYTSTEGVANAFKYYYTGTGDLTLTNPWGGFEGFFMKK